MEKNNKLIAYKNNKLIEYKNKIHNIYHQIIVNIRIELKHIKSKL